MSKIWPKIRSPNAKGHWSLWLAVFAWVTTIFLISSLPGLPTQFNSLSIDKLAHVCVFAILAWLTYFARLPFAIGSAGRIAATIGIVFVCGAIDEIYQRTVPGRDANLLDFGADILGGVLASAALHMWVIRTR